MMNNPLIKVKKLSPSAILPVYAHEGDAGMDVFAITEKDVAPGDTVLIGTGIALEIPNGYEVQVRPRSGLALKHSVTVLNTPGTIDSGYRGEIGVILINHGKTIFHVNQGMKIAQLVVAKYEKVCLIESDSLSETQRQTNGFGSSGI